RRTHSRSHGRYPLQFVFRSGNCSCLGNDQAAIDASDRRMADAVGPFQVAGTEPAFLGLYRNNGGLVWRSRTFVAGLDLEVAPGSIQLCWLCRYYTATSAADLWKLWGNRNRYRIVSRHCHILLEDAPRFSL